MYICGELVFDLVLSKPICLSEVFRKLTNCNLLYVLTSKLVPLTVVLVMKDYLFVTFKFFKIFFYQNPVDCPFLEKSPVLQMP